MSTRSDGRPQPIVWERNLSTAVPLTADTGWNLDQASQERLGISHGKAYML